MQPNSAHIAGSGPANDDCYVLAQRWDDEQGYRSNEGEFWVLIFTPSDKGATVHGAYGNTDPLVGVWRSPSNACFAASGLGEVLYNPDPRALGAHPWKTLDVHVGNLMGVWGLSDDAVYTWGSTSRGGGNVVYRLKDERWQALPPLDFAVHALHGVSPECLFAVGAHGGVARFDGAAWTTFPVPTHETLTSVFAVADDEAYAVGSEGSVLAGNRMNWGLVARGPRLPTGEGIPLLGVAKWNGELWVAGGLDGLFKRQGLSEVLESYKPTLHAVGFEVRSDRLLVTAPQHMVQTFDGVAFKGTGKGGFEALRQGRALYDW